MDHMNPEPPRAAPEPSQHTPAPRETLAGDRLCMRCLHPLAGRAIERDGATGLLFVRCGECGTASALFEYPTLAPWLARLKSVIAGTLMIVAVAVVLAIGGTATGFTAGTLSESFASAASAVVRDWIVEQPDRENLNNGYWSGCDARWLETEPGLIAMARARWAPQVLLTLASLMGLACVILTPFAAFAGIALAARSAFARAIYAALPAAAGSVLGAAIVTLGSTRILAGSMQTWAEATAASHRVAYTAVILAILAGWCALVAAIGPSVAAGLARLILPPRDRRLVAWLWEWRGKRVPNR
jgi:hypothetical protein